MRTTVVQNIISLKNFFQCSFTYIFTFVYSDGKISFVPILQCHRYIVSSTGSKFDTIRCNVKAGCYIPNICLSPGTCPGSRIPTNTKIACSRTTSLKMNIIITVSIHSKCIKSGCICAGSK